MALPTGNLVKVEQSRDEDVVMKNAPRFVSYGEGYPRRTRLDGVSALLRAGEIVENNDRDDGEFMR